MYALNLWLNRKDDYKQSLTFNSNLRAGQICMMRQQKECRFSRRFYCMPPQQSAGVCSVPFRQQSPANMWDSIHWSLKLKSIHYIHCAIDANCMYVQQTPMGSWYSSGNDASMRATAASNWYTKAENSWPAGACVSKYIRWVDSIP